MITEENAEIDLSKLYLSWSYIDSSIDDIDNFNGLAEKILEQYLDEKIKFISEDLLMQNTELINKLMILLIKRGASDYKCKQGHILFLGFCNYFNLDTHFVFNKLHNNIQMIIKTNAKKFIGAKLFNQIERKNNNGIRIRTLNDIL